MRFYEEEEEGERGEAMGAGPTSGMEWAPHPTAYERVLRMAQGNAVVVFSVSGCCMCHVVKRLLLGLGVGPKVYEIDQLHRGEAAGREIQAVLSRLVVGSSTSSASSVEQQTAAVPAVFVGGKLLGGVEKVMACHINGSLIPLLKQAGALWL